MKLVLFIVLLFTSNAFSDVNQDIMLRDNLQSYLNQSEKHLLQKHKNPEQRRLIKNKFTEFNREINNQYKIEDLLGCKYCELVLTCGNRVCEPDKDEDIKNCYEDCAPGLIRSYNKQTICSETSKVYNPKNTRQGQRIIRMAIKNNKRVKVVGMLHSASGVICTDGVTISTSKMNKIFGLETIGGVETVRVGPGTSIYEIVEWLHHRNRSLGLAVVSHRAVTAAGIIGTGAHGSATKETSMLSDIIESIKIIKGDGKIKEYFRDKTAPYIWKSLTMNLGLLGFITELRFRVQENFNMKVKVSYGPDYKLVHFGGILREVKNCDWVQLHWFPATKRFMKSCGNKTDEKAEDGAQNILMGDRIPDDLLLLGVQIYQSAYDKLWALKIMEGLRHFQYLLSPPFLKNGPAGNLNNSANLVGNSYKMLGSEFPTELSRNLLTKDFELAFSEPHILDAIRASRNYFRKYDVSIPLIGSLIRFGRVTNQSYLSLSGKGKNFKLGDLIMYMEINHFKPVGLTAKEHKTYDQFYANWARLMINKYNARVHWGKNRRWAFKSVKKLGRRKKEMKHFQKAIDKLDPNGVFSNKFSKMMGFK